MYLGINIPTASNQHRIQLAHEVIHCCFSKKLLIRYYPNTWRDILSEFQQHGAAFERIADLPFGTVRQGNKLRDELELCFTRNRKLRLILSLIHIYPGQRCQRRDMFWHAPHGRE